MQHPVTAEAVKDSRRRLPCACAILTISFASVLGGATAAHGQVVDRTTSVLDLPRRGYEPRNLRWGSNVIAPELRVEGLFDSNVFATSANEDGDFIINLAPRIDMKSDFGKVRLASDVYVTHREYLQHGRESRTSFGGGTSGKYAISQAHTLNGGVRYDRSVESRADPEANRNPNISPRKIDGFSGNFGYKYLRNRIGIAVQGGVERMNYLSVAEADRDMDTYRGSLRLLTQLSAGKQVYAEAYVNRRNYDLKFDRSGVDRDATTYGFLTGISLDLSSKWRGEMGVGLFRSNPDDPSLKSFSGFGANGRITWSPDERTAVTASVFRGDVATVRGGANGRIDTRIGLRLDQEVRHNFLLSAGVGVRRTSYRGGGNIKQTTSYGEVEAEYLLNRSFSAFANASYSRRTADIVNDRFKRAAVGVGLRLRY